MHALTFAISKTSDADIRRQMRFPRDVTFSHLRVFDLDTEARFNPRHIFQKRRFKERVYALVMMSEREDYCDKLKWISQDNDLNSWIEFFLKAIMQQAEDNSLKVKNIMRLYEDMKGKIQDTTHSQYVIQILDALFFRLIFKATDFTAWTGIAKATSLRYLRQLKDSGILRELSVVSRSKGTVFCFPDLLNIAEGKKTF